MEIDASRGTAQLVSELVELWERSVRASHYFLTDGDIARLLPFVGKDWQKSRCWQWQPTMGAEWGVFAALNRTLHSSADGVCGAWLVW